MNGSATSLIDLLDLRRLRQQIGRRVFSMAEGQFATPGPASYPDDSCRSVRLKAFSAEPAWNHSSCAALYE